MLKAIETRYQGYRFRSRLEARWAVFFDTIGVRWVYEQEGFDLDGEWYLPDFWLPDLKIWVEIKPVEPTERELALMRALVVGSEQGHRSGIILAGVPWPGEYSVCWIWDDVHFADNAPSDGTGYGVGNMVGSTQLCRCHRCNGLSVVETWLEYSPNVEWLPYGEIGEHTCGDHERWPLPFDESHFKPAREARF